jgi:hypothetical protein
MGFAGIYDGYFICKQPSAPPSMEAFLKSEPVFHQYLGHESICYSFEHVNEEVLLTSSFYDNCL